MRKSTSRIHTRNCRHSMATASAAVAVTLTLAVFGTGPLSAAGGAPTTPPPPTIEMTPAQTAAMHYNQGLKQRDKAWDLEEKAKGEDGRERDKLLAKAEKQYTKALRNFETAVENDPKLHQAFSSLGYALRKLGRYQEALVAYDEALELRPTYTEAIEYRGETYLALGRLEETQQAYMELFRIDRPRADELLVAMQAWVEEHRSDPNAAEFAAWVEERAKLAERTAQLSQAGSRAW